MRLNLTQLELNPRSLTNAIEWLPGALTIAAAHRLAGQQHDNLCGPYWLSLLLNAYGVTTLDPTRIGVLAGSILPIGDDPTAWVPPGAVSRHDYTVTLPTCPPESGGTAVPGLIKAAQQASDGQYALVPLWAEWTIERIEMILHLCQTHPDWEAVPVCNVRTGAFWGSRLSCNDAIAYLQGATISPPPADWDVGHFVTLAATIQGSARSLLVVRDTYPVLGWDGYHLQPAAAIAAALNRGDGSQGGILLFVSTTDQAAIEHVFKEQAFAIAPWDNGTPWEA